MSTEQWLGPKQIAAQYNVSYDTARRWIMRVMGDDERTRFRDRSGKRPRKIRRVPRSLLEKNLDELING